MTTGPEKPGALYVLHLTEQEMSNLIFCVDTTLKVYGAQFARQGGALMAECDHAFAAAEKIRAALEGSFRNETEAQIDALREIATAVGKLH